MPEARPTLIWPLLPLLPHPLPFLPDPQAHQANLHSNPSAFVVPSSWNVLPQIYTQLTHSPPACLHPNVTWTRRPSLTTPLSFCLPYFILLHILHHLLNTLYICFFSFSSPLEASSMRGGTQSIRVQWFNLYPHFTDENTESQGLHTGLMLKLGFIPKPLNSKPSALFKGSPTPKPSFYN